MTEFEKVKHLASQVVDNDHLKRILYDSKPELRKQVYLMLVPYLRFKAKSFKWMRFKTYA